METLQTFGQELAELPTGDVDAVSTPQPISNGIASTLQQPPNTEVSTTEEPDAGKLHVRVCGGGAG
jgi:hypothetical protein